MMRESLIDEKEHIFTYLSPSVRQIADVHCYNKEFYFTKFPGIEPEMFNQVLRKTIREIRKNGMDQIPDNLSRFFNAQQRRKRFNLAPGVWFNIDIYDKVSLKLIIGLDKTNYMEYDTKYLVNHFNSLNIIHIYDPKPMPKDLFHKNAKLKDFNSDISRYHGYQILNRIRNEEINLHGINLLNWNQTIPLMKIKEIGMRKTSLHLAVGAYKIKIGNQEEQEGYIISFNDKGPMVVFDGNNVESSNLKYQLELVCGFPEKNILSKNEKIIPELSSISFERENTPIFMHGAVLHPKDERFSHKKDNSQHSEFKILNNFVHQLRLLEINDNAEITGELFILSEKNPCYGCLDLLWNQFNAQYPNITLKYKFVYGICASENGFEKIDLEKENTPIVVPNTQEERNVGFLRHSEFLLEEVIPNDEIYLYLSAFKRFEEMKKSIGL